MSLVPVTDPDDGPDPGLDCGPVQLTKDGPPLPPPPALVQAGPLADDGPDQVDHLVRSTWSTVRSGARTVAWGRSDRTGRVVLKAAWSGFQAWRSKRDDYVNNRSEEWLVHVPKAKEDTKEYRTNLEAHNAVVQERQRIRRVTNVVMVLLTLVGLGLALGFLGFPLTVLATFWSFVAAGRHHLSNPDPDGPDVPEAAPVRSAVQLDQATVQEALVRKKVVPEGTAVRTYGLKAEGNGWSVGLDLDGEQAVKMVQAIPALAAHFHTRPELVHVELDRDDASRGRLWLPEEDPLGGPATRSPLLDMVSVCMSEGIPWGRDRHGRGVLVTFAGTHWLVGGDSGSGKTFTFRVPVYGCALDPNVSLVISDPQGMTGWKAFSPLARVFSGTSPETMAELADYLEWIQKDEFARRAAKLLEISEAGTHEVEEDKLTEAIASDRALDLPWLVIVMEECHRSFAYGDIGKRIKAAVWDIITRGRAFGVSVALSTQKPSDNNIPTDIRDICTTLFAMSIRSQAGAKMILGDDYRERGMNPVTLRPDTNKGAGYLTGVGLVQPEGVDFSLLRGDYVNVKAGGQLLDRGLRLRQAERPELLPGGRCYRGPSSLALPAPPSTSGVELPEAAPQETVLDHLVAVLDQADAPALHGRQLADGLRAGWPKLYPQVTNRDLNGLVSPYAPGLVCHLVYALTPEGERKRQKGLERAELVDARDAWVNARAERTVIGA